MLVIILVCLFFFKQKTAYEMRISDWSSDVCSSDLAGIGAKRNLDAGLVSGCERLLDLRADLARLGGDLRRVPALVSFLADVFAGDDGRHVPGSVLFHQRDVGLVNVGERKRTRLNSSP